MEFATECTISATADRVWRILTDLPSWPEWNSTVISTEGSIALGNKVKFTVTANPGRAFTAKVSTLVQSHRMVFTGGMPLGLFVGERTFTLDPTDEGVRFRMRETFTGPLSGMIGKQIPDLQASFDEFASCLKATSEAA